MDSTTVSTAQSGLTAPDDEQARLDAAFAAADAKLSARSQNDPNDPTSDRAFRDRAELIQQEGPDGAGVIERTARAAAIGVAKAGFETKDFLVGEPKEEDKAGIRQSFEAQGRALAEKSAGYGLTTGVTQMVTGLIGAGKFLAPFKLAQKLKAGGKAAVLAYETGKAALASTVVLDPHEDRLSNLVESYPALQNPVTAYLAADPNDSVAEGRFKNALESIGVDLALVGVVKAIKLFKAGDVEAGAKEVKKLQAAEEVKAAASAPDVAAGNQPIGKDTPVDALAAETPGAHGEGGTVPPTSAGPKSGEPTLPPKEIKTQEIADRDIEEILHSTASDEAAIRLHGSKDEAIAEGHKFGGTAKLPWQKLHTTGGAEQLIERTTEILSKRFDAAKGGAKMSDDSVAATANEIADLYGEDPALVMGQIAQAGADAPMMVSRMEAGLRIGNRMFQDAEDLRVRIQNGNLNEFGGNAAMATQEWMGRLAVSLDTLASSNSILSNSARTMRRARGQFRLKPADLARIKSMDPQKAMVIVDKAGGDLKKVSMLLNESWSSRVLNEATWHLTNGLLWLWPTHVVNTTTNAFMLAARPTEKLFGSVALRLITKDPGKRAELSSLSRQALKEYTYTVTALADGWSNAVEAFKRGDSILNPHNTEFFQSGTGIQTHALPWKPWNSVADLAQNAWMSANYRTMVGLPTRALGAADEFFKTLRYRAVIQSQAAVDAADRGLEGEAATRFVQDAMDRAIDPATGQALDAKATSEAQRATFQQDLNYPTHMGSAGQALQNFRKTFPVASLVVPFIKTPVNVIRYSMRMTPGLNLLQKEFMEDMLGKTGAMAQAHAVGQFAMGSMFMGLAAHLAINDRFTGGGPGDPELKKDMMASGWRPYAIPFRHEDGTTTYFQLGRFDPVAMAMGMVADIVALKKKNPDQDYDALILATSLAVAKNLGDKGFLLTLDSALGAMMDPANQGTKFAGRTLGSMVPFSSLLRGHNPDPYMRDARGFVDSFMQGIPGLSTSLPVSMDVWGDPVERHIGVQGIGGNDIVEAEHNRIMLQTDKGLGKPASKFEGLDLRDITLTTGKNAYQRLQELSGHLPNGAPSLKEVLKSIIESEAYQDLPDGDSDVLGTRLNLLGKKAQAYREAAKKVLIQENPELQPLVKARQRDTLGAIQENQKKRKSQQPGAKELLDTLTYGGPHR